MYLEIFQADFAVLRVFLGISRDFAEIPKIRGSVTARNIRSPVNNNNNNNNTWSTYQIYSKEVSLA